MTLSRHERGPQSVADDPDWEKLGGAWRELLRLVGEGDLRGTRAIDLSRHLRFGLGVSKHPTGKVSIEPGYENPT